MRTFLMATSVFLLLLTDTSLAQGHALKVLPNIDLPGQDYKSLKRVSFRACWRACSGNTRCRAFTFHRKKRICWLKSGRGRAVRFRGLTSGRKVTRAGNAARNSSGRQSRTVRVATTSRRGQTDIALRDNRHPLSRVCVRHFRKWQNGAGFAVFATSKGGACSGYWGKESMFEAGLNAVRACKKNARGRDRRSCRIFATKAPKAIGKIAGLIPSHSKGLFDLVEPQARLGRSCLKLFRKWLKTSGSGAFAAPVRGKCWENHDKSDLIQAQKSVLENCRKTDKTKGRRSCRIIARRQAPARRVLPAPKLDTLAVSNCGSIETGLKTVASSASIQLDKKQVKAGGGVKMTFTFKQAKKRLPLYMMMSFDQPVRFAGTGYYILSPGAKAAFDLKHAKNRTRLVVPLYVTGGDLRKEIEIRPMLAGRLELQASIVAASGCGEKETQILRRMAVTVRPGQPRMVIADEFSLKKPKQTILSPARDRAIEIFEGGDFRLVDRNTGRQIVSLGGKQPRFSPTGRFLASINDGVLEVRDAIDGRVTVTDAGVGDVAWDNKDSFLIIGGIGVGAVTVSSPFAEKGEALGDSYVGGRGFRGLGASTAKIDLENNVYLAGNASDREAVAVVLTDALFYSSQILSDDLTRGFSQITVTKKGKIFSQDVLLLLKKTYGSPRNFVQSTNQLVPLEFPRWDDKALSWEFIERPQFTHYYVDLAADPKGANDLIKRPDSFGDLPGYLTKPRLASNNRTSDKKLLLARNRRVSLARSVQAIGSSPGAENRTFANRLAGFGITIQKSVPFERLAKPFVRTGTTREKEGIFKYRHNRSIKLIEKHPDHMGDKEFAKADRSLTINTHDAVVWRAVVNKRKLVVFGGGFLGGNAGYTRTAMRLFDSKSPKRLHRIHSTTPYQARLNPGISCPEAGCDYHLSISHNRYLLIWSKDFTNSGFPSVEIVDLLKGKTRQFIPYRGNLIENISLSADARTLIQKNSDGSFALHDMSKAESMGEYGYEQKSSLEKTVLLYGRYADDEIVVWTPSGHFDATYEGADQVKLVFAGVPVHFSFDQFEATLRRKGLAQKVLARSFKEKRAEFRAPPTISGTVKQAGADLQLAIRSAPGQNIRQLLIYQDGLLSDRIEPREASSNDMEAVVKRQPGARYLSIVGIDEHKLASKPLLRDLGASASKRTLHILGVGIDQYSDPRNNLKYARTDINRLAKALQETKSNLYDQRIFTPLFDEDATRLQILAELEKVLASSGTGTDIMLAFAGHGVQGSDGRYYLGLGSTDFRDLENTAIAWEEIARLVGRSRSRVVIFLDSCHSGEAGKGLFTTNNNVVDEILSSAGSNVIVFSGSKGREETRENKIWGGGVFTQALVRAFQNSDGATDKNGNGLLEASEIYLAVKQYVVGQVRQLQKLEQRVAKTRTVKSQTPWMARNKMIGDVVLW